METWVEVEAKGRKWIVSSLGNVKAPSQTVNVTRIRNGRMQTFTSFQPERKLSPSLGNHGYLEVSIQINGKRNRETVHRLVGFGFVNGYSEGLTINHINGIKTDNRPENLEWVDLARNTQLQWETGLVNLRGENAPCHKLTSKRVVYIRKLLQQGINPHTLSIVAGVSPELIYFIRDGKRWASV